MHEYFIVEPSSCSTSLKFQFLFCEVAQEKDFPAHQQLLLIRAPCLLNLKSCDKFFLINFSRISVSQLSSNFFAVRADRKVFEAEKINHPILVLFVCFKGYWQILAKTFRLCSVAFSHKHRQMYNVV